MESTAVLDTAGRALFVGYFLIAGLCNASRINLLNNTGVRAGLLLLLANVR